MTRTGSRWGGGDESDEDDEAEGKEDPASPRLRCRPVADVVALTRAAVGGEARIVEDAGLRIGASRDQGPVASDAGALLPRLSVVATSSAPAPRDALLPMVGAEGTSP